MKKLLTTSSLVALACTPLLSHAESTTVTSAVSGSTATAKLDFTITVPAVLYVRIGVGNGIGAANNTGVDNIVFNVPATNIGDGSVISATSGGDVSAGAVTVRVFSNVGTNVSLNSSVVGTLNNGGVDTIPWSQISVTPAALGATTAGFTNGAITHPAFAAVAGNGTATTLTAVGRLVRQEGKWTYTYANSAVKPAGSYGGVNVNNGRITYTVTQL